MFNHEDSENQHMVSVQDVGSAIEDLPEFCLVRCQHELAEVLNVAKYCHLSSREKWRV